jgi:hypothetical protein
MAKKRPSAAELIEQSRRKYTTKWESLSSDDQQYLRDLFSELDKQASTVSVSRLLELLKAQAGIEMSRSSLDSIRTMLKQDAEKKRR